MTISVSPASVSGVRGVSLAGKNDLKPSGGKPPYTFKSDLFDVLVDKNGHVHGTPNKAETGSIVVRDSSIPAQTADVPVRIAAEAPTPSAGALTVTPGRITFQVGRVGTESLLIERGVAPYRLTNLPDGIAYNGAALVANGRATLGTTVVNISDSTVPVPFTGEVPVVIVA